MFETDQYEKQLRDTDSVIPQQYDFVSNVQSMSFLLWSEHCIECAAPDCFQTCELYQARPDLRCRRFQFGMFRNEACPSMRASGIEVVFKKWAKLETHGNTRMIPFSLLLWLEKTNRIIAPILNFFGSILRRPSKDIRFGYLNYALFNRLVKWLHSEEADRIKPDGFLLEIYNPESTPIKIQLIISIAYYDLTEGTSTSNEQIPAFRTTLTLNQGYSRHEFDRALFQTITNSGLPFDVALIPEADSSAKLVLLTADFVKYSNQKQLQPKAKCIVWDLDNTLWQGVLLEDDNVPLNLETVEIIKYLDERGILNSIASKNDHDQAWAKLQEFGLADYFLAPHINWTPKSENIKNIAKQLNIGLDTFAFIDDNPFELEEVSSTLPTVTCIGIKDINRLLTDPIFEGSQTSDAKNRRHFYKDALQRDDIKSSFGGDYIDFLASCQIKLNIRPCEDEDMERVEELVQRTNQLNFSGRKYKKEEVQALIKDNKYKKFVLRCADKYGDYGIVGFSLVKQEEGILRIDDFMLSCRVQGKFIEQAFFSHLIKNHNLESAKALHVGFTPTTRNRPAQLVLESLEFEKSAQDSGLVLDISENDLNCSFINVICTECNTS